MTTPISFPIAKLLKEKGFDNLCEYLWHFNGSDCIKMINKNSENFGFSAPPIAEVVMWLYEKHGIWISVDWMKRSMPYNSGFYCHLRGTNKSLNQDNFIVINDTLAPGYEVFSLPTEAYEAAIKYTLKHLI